MSLIELSACQCQLRLTRHAKKYSWVSRECSNSFRLGPTAGQLGDAGNSVSLSCMVWLKTPPDHQDQWQGLGKLQLELYSFSPAGFGAVNKLLGAKPNHDVAHECYCELVGDGLVK